MKLMTQMAWVIGAFPKIGALHVKRLERGIGLSLVKTEIGMLEIFLIHKP